jgi:hypothetical protein
MDFLREDCTANIGRTPLPQEFRTTGLAAATLELRPTRPAGKSERLKTTRACDQNRPKSSPAGGSEQQKRNLTGHEEKLEMTTVDTTLTDMQRGIRMRSVLTGD